MVAQLYQMSSFQFLCVKGNKNKKSQTNCKHEKKKIHGRKTFVMFCLLSPSVNQPIMQPVEGVLTPHKGTVILNDRLELLPSDLQFNAPSAKNCLLSVKSSC